MVGGQAFPSGVAFYTDELRVKAIRDRGQTIQVEVTRQASAPGRLMKRFGAIPFLRGLVLLVELYVTQWKLGVVSLLIGCICPGILMIVMGDRYIQNMSSDLLVHMSRYLCLLMAMLMMVVVLVIRFSQVSRYHGAEHQVYGAYKTYESIERDQVLATSRVSTSCGSNLAMLVVLCFCLLSLFPLAWWIKFILSCMVGYEIFLFDESGKWGWVVAPFYRISGFLQGCFLTRKPSERELEVAETALRVLLEELAQRKECAGME